MDKKQSILVFGVGELQKSIIEKAKSMGLFVVGIDPFEDAYCKGDVDAFEVVGGQDFEGTLAVARKYDVKAVITAATDKPLVMMARVAKELGLRFYSEEAAIWSTDKFQMKQRFIEGGILCARGRVIKSVEEVEGLDFPLILKPRDNSGSRGVVLCRDLESLRDAMQDTLQYTKLDSVLVEEFIEGQEYSIEALHFDDRSEVIQFTEKTTTPFPYNVELQHIQPALLSDDLKEQIRLLISQIANVMKFENCASHTELKVNERGIFIIETSPRLGGDFITSTLTPLSTGINIEEQLLNISLDRSVDICTGKVDKSSAVCFFVLDEGEVVAIDEKIHDVLSWEGVKMFDFKLRVGDKVNKITSSLNRYGQFVVMGENRKEVEIYLNEYYQEIESFIRVNKI